MTRIPPRTVGRLSLYRRLLDRLHAEKRQFVYSHDLAHMAGVTAAQVRRDLMVLGSAGSANRGYQVEALITGIDELLDSPEGQKMAIAGVGNLGRAVLAYFSGRRPKLSIAAAFDTDETKVGRVIMGCRIYPLTDLERIVRTEGISVGIVAVPAAAAQGVAEALVRAGVRGIMNFAPVPLKLPAMVHVEELDITTSIEKVAYYAKHSREKVVSQ